MRLVTLVIYLRVCIASLVMYLRVCIASLGVYNGYVASLGCITGM